MAELLPCPFCGGEAKIYQNYMGQYNIQCEKCRCVFWTKNCRRVDYVKIAWNTRTPKGRGGNNNGKDDSAGGKE